SIAMLLEAGLPRGVTVDAIGDLAGFGAIMDAIRSLYEDARGYGTLVVEARIEKSFRVVSVQHCVRLSCSMIWLQRDTWRCGNPSSAITSIANTGCGRSPLRVWRVPYQMQP